MRRRRRISPLRIVGWSVLAALIATPVVLYFVFLINDRPPAISIPAPPMPPPAANAYFDFVRAAQLSGAMRHKAPADMPSPPTTRAAYIAACAACAKDATPALAAMCPGFGKTFTLPPVRGIAMPLPVFAQFRELERTVSGVVAYYELTGRPAQAADAAVDGAEMAVMIAHNAPLIADLVGVACQSIALRDLDALIPRLSAAELARVAQRLQSILRKETPFGDILREEQLASASEWIAGFADPRSRGMLSLFRDAQELDYVAERNRSRVARYVAAARFVMADKTALIRQEMRYYELMAAEADRPYRGRSTVPVPDNPCTEGEADTLQQSRMVHEAARAALVVLSAEVALYRYRLAHGRYPDRLRDLAPAYLPAVPADPFGGGAGVPLVYRAQRGGANSVLYSRGKDLADNGCRPGQFPADGPGTDIVAGHIWTPVHYPQ